MKRNDACFDSISNFKQSAPQLRIDRCDLEEGDADFTVLAPEGAETMSTATYLQGPSGLPLKGNSHQILFSEMSLPGVKVPIEKLLPKILGRLGKENPSKTRCKVAFVQRKCAVTSSVLVRFLYATYN